MDRGFSTQTEKHKKVMDRNSEARIRSLGIMVLILLGCINAFYTLENRNEITTVRSKIGVFYEIDSARNQRYLTEKKWINDSIQNMTRRIDKSGDEVKLIATEIELQKEINRRQQDSIFAVLDSLFK